MDNTTKAEGLWPVLNRLQITKSNAQQVAEELLARCADGRFDLLDVHARLSFYAEVDELFASDSTRAAIRKLIDERGAGTGKVLTDAGEYAAQATGTRYEYAEDLVWRDLRAAELEAINKRKAREEFLKKLPGTIKEGYKGPGSRTKMITTRPVSSTSVDGFRFTMNKGAKPAPVVAPEPSAEDFAHGPVDDNAGFVGGA